MISLYSYPVTHSYNLLVSAFLLLLSIPLVTAQEAHEATFEGLGFIPGGGFQSSPASGVSEDGLVVVGSGESVFGGVDEAYRWEDGQIEGLGFLPVGTESDATDVSANGAVVVGIGVPHNPEENPFLAFRWTETQGMEALGVLRSDGTGFSDAYAVSDDGTVVVGDASSDNGIIEAFRWSQSEGMQGLGDLPGGTFNSNAFGVSADGSVVVGSSEAENGRDLAFIWTEADGMQPLFSGGTDNATAVDVTADGSVVVGTTFPADNSRSEAFRFTPGNREDLGDLPGGDFRSVARAISADGTIVVGTGHTDDGFEAFVVSQFGVMLNVKDVLEEGYGLDLTGWTLTEATDVTHTEAGVTIVGEGINPDGQQEGWRAALPRFPGVGDLPGGVFISEVNDVSANGSVAVGRGFSDNGSEAFRLEDGVLESLGDLDGGIFTSQAHAISADGTVVVGEGFSGEGFEAFRWTENEGLVGLGDLPGDDFFSEAHAVSANGGVVVGRGDSDEGFEAFRWEDGNLEGLGDFPGGSFFSEANGVSADGSVVVGRGSSDNGNEAFRWTEAGGMIGLGDLPGGNFTSTAEAVSADGSVVVGGSSSENGFEAFRWTEDGGMVGLGDLPGDDFSSRANAVSADGSIVVGESDTDGGDPFGTEAFIWTENEGMQNLAELVEEEYGAAFSGWVFAEATGVGVAGGDTVVVAGIGMNPLGLNEGFRIPLTVIGPIANEPTPGETANVLSRPTPNPASDLTTLRIGVERTQDMVVAVFDALGRRVKTLFNGALAGGTSETLTLDASALPAGMYIIRATGEGFTETRRVTVVR